MGLGMGAGALQLRVSVGVGGGIGGGGGGGGGSGGEASYGTSAAGALVLPVGSEQATALAMIDGAERTARERCSLVRAAHSKLAADLGERARGLDSQEAALAGELC
eukprot:965977-Prymnesium_polylepis.1